MRCPRCSSENARSTTVCIHCGTPLRAARPSTRKRIPWYAGVGGGLLLVSLAYFLVFQDRAVFPRLAPEETSGTEAAPQPSADPGLGGAQSAPTLSLGQVAVSSRIGEHVFRFRTAVLDGAWIALPLWSVVGGDVWQFEADGGDKRQLTRGFWKEGMPLGLWQLDSPLAGEPTPLSPWDRDAPLYWQSLEGPTAPLNRVSLDSVPRPYGLLARLPIPAPFQKPGVFLQQDRIVGWTFGSGWDFAFLWTGTAAAALAPNIRAADLVGVAFVGSQERYAALALSKRRASDELSELRALLQGLSLPVKIPPEDKPAEMQAPVLKRRMSQLADKLEQSGQADEIARLIDEDLIRAIQDSKLLMTATRARLSISDHRRALRFFENLRSEVSSESRLDQAAMDRFQLGLYKDWIQNDIEQELLSRGWEAFEAGQRAFPDDADLHLLGVELAIAGKEWGRAEDLLKNRTFPAAFKTRASNLEVILLELKSEEGKITIRFPAGASEIPIEILVNKRKIQRFVLDTGATMVTIPSASLEQLGITIDSDTPVLRVSTASGYMLAYEVSLNQMEIKGQRVFNVPALVLDIPGQPGIGLLGQSFLQSFEVEIDGRRGILRLKRK